MIAAAATTAAAATRRAIHGSIPDGRGRCFPAGLIGCCRDGVASPPFPELIPRMMDPQVRRIRPGQSYARDLTKSSHRRPGRVPAGCRHAPGCHVIGGHRCAGHSEHITTLRVQRWQPPRVQDRRAERRDCARYCRAIRLPSVMAFASVELPEEELPDVLDRRGRHQTARSAGSSRPLCRRQ